MTEPFNVEKEIKNLKEIYDANTASKAEVKRAIINNLPKVDNEDTKDFMSHLGIEKTANTPAEGLEKKMKYWKEKDSSVQKRIVYAQSWNLAVSLLTSSVSHYGYLSGNNGGKEGLKKEIESWQKYFYQKLSEGDQNNG